MLSDPFDLTAHVAVVTGASSGLGARFVEVLSDRGALVVAAARRAERLTRAAQGRPRVVPFPCDVTVAEDREALIATAHALAGRLDILVNNAGIGSNVRAVDETLDVFDRVIDVNLRATFALSLLAARQMIGAGGGSIINIASILGLVASAPIAQSVYGAAKGGVISLTRHLAVEWAPANVRVNAVAPGWFPSELTQEMFADDRAMAWIRRNTPMGRAGSIEELDGVILLLASRAGGYITGQTIVVDGGWTAR